MIGMSRVAGSPLRATTSSRPDFFGIMMSLTTTSGRLSHATSMPSCPSRARRTSNPSISKFTSSSLRITGSSSTTRTVLSATRSMLLRGARADDLGSQTRFESEPFVDTDRTDVLFRHVEQRGLSSIADSTDEVTHQGGGQPAATGALVGAHRADLDVARSVHAHPGHGDEDAVVVTDAQIVAELDRATLERAGPRAIDQRQHVVDVIDTEHCGGAARGALDAGAHHLQRREPKRPLPVGRPRRRLAEPDRDAAHPHQVAQRVPP